MLQSMRRLATAALGALVLTVGVVSAPPVQARSGLLVFAPLSGPALGRPGLVPVGRGRYRERGNQDFLVEMYNVNLPNFTPCTAWLNGAPMGTAPLFAGIAFFPFLDTLAGDTVPVVQPGDVVTITAAGVGPILTGVFGEPAPVLPFPVSFLGGHLLSGGFNGFVPTGGMAWNVFRGLKNQLYKDFACEVFAVNLPEGTPVDVVRFRGSKPLLLGTMTIDALHHGAFSLSSATKNPPPSFSRGDVIKIMLGSEVILIGSMT